MIQFIDNIIETVYAECNRRTTDPPVMRVLE